MPADARSSQLRQAREGIDTGRGVLRTAGNPVREAAIGRGTFMNWYQDLGISTTEPQALQIRKEEADFQSKISEKRAKVQEARGQLQGAWGQLSAGEQQLNEAAGSYRPPEVGSAIEDSWNQFRSTLVPIEVASVSYGTITNSEGTEMSDTNNQTLNSSTYYFPQELAYKLLTTKGIRGDQLDNGGMRIKADYNMAKQLNSEFSSQEKILESSYKEKAARAIEAQLAGVEAPDFSGQYAELGRAKGTLSDYQAQVDAAQADLDASVAKRQKEWDDLHNKYKDKIDNMNEIFSGLQIKKGTKDDSK